MAIQIDVSDTMVRFASATGKGLWFTVPGCLNEDESREAAESILTDLRAMLAAEREEWKPTHRMPDYHHAWTGRDVMEIGRDDRDRTSILVCDKDGKMTCVREYSLSPLTAPAPEKPDIRNVLCRLARTLNDAERAVFAEWIAGKGEA